MSCRDTVFKGPYDHLSTAFLQRWLKALTSFYVKDVSNPILKKDGCPHAGWRAAVETGATMIRMLNQELRRRGA